MLSRKKGRRDDEDNNLRETGIYLSREWVRGAQTHRKGQKDSLNGETAL